MAYGVPGFISVSSETELPFSRRFPYSSLDPTNTMEQPGHSFRAASIRFTAATMLISMVFAGIFQLRPTLACPARWKMTSGCSSFSSVSTASGSSRFTATVFSPGTRSRPVTSYPFAVSSARRYFPTNPSLPVISAFFIISETLNSSFFILHFSFLKLASCLASLRSCSAMIAHSSS